MAYGTATFVLAETKQFILNATKNGVVWNLTSATVSLLLEKPDGTTLTKSATITNPTGGVASYTTLTTDLNAVGKWWRSWSITDGAVTLKDVGTRFTVTEAPGPLV
jgi:hypothetical protein